MGAVLTTEPVQHMLADQGFSPGWGLGRDPQGDPQVVTDKGLTVRYGGDRAGLENLF